MHSVFDSKFILRERLPIISARKMFWDCSINMVCVDKIPYFIANIKSSYRCVTYVDVAGNVPAMYNLNLNCEEG